MTLPGSLEQTLAALADPSRRQVVEHLSRQPLPAGELARRVDLSAAALSRHLRILKSVGLISEVPLSSDARVRVYALKPAPMAALKAWVGQVEIEWSHQTERLRHEHLEA